MKIVFATGNVHKLREAQEILGEGYELVTPASLGITEEIPETGDTLEANSLQKAEFLRDRAGDALACFADDTGLEVEALGGAPGVYTARYAELVARREGHPDPTVNHDFAANMDTLLSELAKLGPDVPRTARFRSVVTLIAGGSVYSFEGVMEGRIAESKAGCGGFGYDPVFIADDYPDLTVAEISEEAKNAISHRGKALRAMAEWLRAHPLVDLVTPSESAVRAD